MIIRERILKALERHGPMTTSQINDHIRVNIKSVRAEMVKLRMSGDVTGREVNHVMVYSLVRPVCSVSLRGWGYA